MSKLKIVFLGTPELACPFLSRIVADGYRVSGVISQPDRLQGRGMKLCCPPVKNKAGQLSLEVFQPRTAEDLIFALSEFKPDLGVAVAYGRLIKKEALAIPRLGFLNVHFSLLPKYRGAAPVQRALMNGEKETGVTLFWLDKGMDTGPVFLRRAVPIPGDEDAAALFVRLAGLGADLLAEGLEKAAAGEILREPHYKAHRLHLTNEHNRLSFQRKERLPCKFRRPVFGDKTHPNNPTEDKTIAEMPLIARPTRFYNNICLYNVSDN